MHLNFRPWRRTPRIGAVLGLQNEDRFLAAHLAYHRFVGVERFYLFLDRSTDRSAAIAAGFPGVRAVRVSPQAPPFEYVADFHRWAADLALEWAREDGLDWLLLIDPDEFAFADNPVRGPAKGAWSLEHLKAAADLRTMAARVPDSIIQIHLATREVLPCRQWSCAPFHHQVLFHGDPPVEHRLVDPEGREVAVWKNFLGHRQGQRLVRVRAPVQTFDSHRWVPEQHAARPQRPEFNSLPTVSLGWHAHYFITGADHWKNKYRQLQHEPPVWFCGTPVETPIQLWKQVYQAMPDGLDEYIERYVLLGEDEAGRLESSGRAVRDDRLHRLITAALACQPATEAPADALESTDFQTVLHPPQRACGPDLWELSPARLPPSCLRGFHPVALRRGRLHRWSAPEASITLDAGPGSYRLEGLLAPWAPTRPARDLVLLADGARLTIHWHLLGCRRFHAETGPVPGLRRLDLRAPAEPRKDSCKPRSLPWLELTLRRL